MTSPLDDVAVASIEAHPSEDWRARALGSRLAENSGLAIERTEEGT